MIYDILDALDTELNDETAGVNARIVVVNTLKSTNVPAMTEILTWTLKKLPAQMKMPTMQLVWNGSRDLELQSQGKWRGDHLISLNFWTNEKTAEEARKDIAIWAHAARLFVDDIPDDIAGVDEVRDVSIDVAGWAGAGKLYTWMAISFRVKERDENPE